mmetsp:Transcript_21545/g.34197  ORF Transcript_21545/g.34197 Transcript_21545/m.34197 type:complete len:210 (+) Transcript_21545:509-1138(+)
MHPPGHVAGCNQSQHYLQVGRPGVWQHCTSRATHSFLFMHPKQPIHFPIPVAVLNSIEFRLQFLQVSAMQSCGVPFNPPTTCNPIGEGTAIRCFQSRRLIRQEGLQVGQSYPVPRRRYYPVSQPLHPLASNLNIQPNKLRVISHCPANPNLVDSSVRSFWECMWSYVRAVLTHSRLTFMTRQGWLLQHQGCKCYCQHPLLLLCLAMTRL